MENRKPHLNPVYLIVLWEILMANMKWMLIFDYILIHSQLVFTFYMEIRSYITLRKYKNLRNALSQIINWPIAILTFTCKYAIENNHVVSYNHIT